MTDIKLNEMDLLKLQTLCEKERRHMAEEREIQARLKYLKLERMELDTEKKKFFGELEKTYGISRNCSISFETGEVTAQEEQVVTQ